MRLEDADILRQIAMFHDVSGHDLETLLQPAFLQRFPPQVLLMRQGDAADFLHIVMDGLLDCFVHHAGRDFGLFLAGRGAILPLASVVETVPNLLSARVLEPSNVLMIPAAAVRAVFARNPAFAVAVGHALAADQNRLLRELANQKMRPSSERLANWMLKEIAGQGGSGNIMLRIDKRTLASLIGTTPENLSRNFGILASHGVVVRGREIIVEDKHALASFASPHPVIDESTA